MTPDERATRIRQSAIDLIAYLNTVEDEDHRVIAFSLDQILSLQLGIPVPDKVLRELGVTA